MSDTQVAALDHAVQQTNIWLKTLGEELHVEDRHAALMALRAVLHVLRDRLTAEQPCIWERRCRCLSGACTTKAGAWPLCG